MRPISFKCGVFLVCGVLAVAGRPALVNGGDDDAKKTIPAGIWEKKNAEPKLEFSGEDKLTIFPHGANVAFQIDCSYTASKDGVVKVKITRLGGADDVIEKAKGSVPVGMEFQFKWKIEGDKAKLDDVDGKDVEQVKAHLEGEYAKTP